MTLKAIMRFEEFKKTIADFWNGYFGYAKNAQHAKELHGVTVDNPTLVLVIGNVENADVDHDNQACRPFSDIHVVNWDMMCQLFISNRYRR